MLSVRDHYCPPRAVCAEIVVVTPSRNPSRSGSEPLSLDFKMAAAAAAAAGPAPGPRVLVKVARNIARIKCEPGDMIADLRPVLPTIGINPQSAFYAVTDDALWTLFKANPDAEADFLRRTPLPEPIDDERPVVDGMRLLAVPPALPAVAGKSASLSRDFARSPASRRPSLIMPLVSRVLFVSFSQLSVGLVRLVSLLRVVVALGLSTLSSES